MSQQTAAASGFGEAARAIRAKLLACRGAQLCNAPGCQVITQDGQSGARKHRQVVHPELEWI